MREIKFKAWNETAKRFSKPFGLMSDVLNYTDDDGLGVMKSLTDEKVYQYTGLKDKNGTEIYEGDKILYMDATGEVYYCNYTCMFMAKFPLHRSEWSFDSMDDLIEVIGNIHSAK